MSDNTEHAHIDYWKIYKWLLLLFAISVLGPALFPSIKFIVLLTAFGIAIIKALLVAGNFMHLNVERKYIWHLFLICLVFLLVLFAGTASDILNKHGNNWVRQGFRGVAAATPDEHAEQPEPKPEPKPDPKLIAEGKVLFQTKICFTCHQTDPAVPAPAGLALKATKFIGDFWGKEREVLLDGDPKTPLLFEPGGKTVKVKLDEAYFMESVEKPFAKIVKGAIPGMAPLPTTPEERQALLAYVQSLSKK